MITIIKSTTTEQLDKDIIPYELYDYTINKDKLSIQNYLILHPYLLYSFVGYNGALKLANQLSSDKKCGCYYTIPWKTYYGHTTNTSKNSLTFSQQVEEYRYMILNWYPSPKMSYMQYLSQIALSMVLDISQYMYYTSNNLYPCSFYQKKYYSDNFANEILFRKYIYYYFSKLNKKYIY